MITLKDRALQALENRRKQELEKKSAGRRKLSEKMAEDIDPFMDKLLHPSRMSEIIYEYENPNWPLVAILEGVTFTGVQGNIDEFTVGYLPALIGTCPRCNEQVPGKPIRELADLGESFENFKPDASHKCSAVS